MRRSPNLPMHVQFFIPILEALRTLGGSATQAELKDTLVSSLNISDDDLDEKLKTGVTRIDNQIAWSKVYLEREGLVQSSESGVWNLTHDGINRKLSNDDVGAIFKKIHGGFLSQERQGRG